MLCGGSKYEIHVNVHVHIMNGVYKAELEDLNSLMMKHWICTRIEDPKWKMAKKITFDEQLLAKVCV